MPHLRRIFWGAAVVFLVGACRNNGRMAMELKAANAELESQREKFRELGAKETAVRQELENLLAGEYERQRIKELGDRVTELEANLEKAVTEESATRQIAAEAKKRFESYQASNPRT